MTAADERGSTPIRGHVSIRVDRRLSAAIRKSRLRPAQVTSPEPTVRGGLLVRAVPGCQVDFGGLACGCSNSTAKQGALRRKALPGRVRRKRPPGGDRSV